MRIALPILVGLLVVAAGSAFAVNTGDKPLPFTMGPMPGEVANDLPIRVNDFGLRADTTWYGQYTDIGGEYYAIDFLNDRASGCWTFDRGTGPAGVRTHVITNGEGWSVRDLTANESEYWKVIDSS